MRGFLFVLHAGPILLVIILIPFFILCEQRLLLTFPARKGKSKMRSCSQGIFPRMLNYIWDLMHKWKSSNPPITLHDYITFTLYVLYELICALEMLNIIIIVSLYIVSFQVFLKLAMRGLSGPSLEQPPRASMMMLYCVILYSGYLLASSSLSWVYFVVFSISLLSLFSCHGQLISSLVTVIDYGGINSVGLYVGCVGV